MSPSMIFMLLHHPKVNCISTLHMLLNWFSFEFPVSFYHVDRIVKQQTWPFDIERIFCCMNCVETDWKIAGIPTDNNQLWICLWRPKVPVFIASYVWISHLFALILGLTLPVFGSLHRMKQYGSINLNWYFHTISVIKYSFNIKCWRIWKILEERFHGQIM